MLAEWAAAEYHMSLATIIFRTPVASLVALREAAAFRHGSTTAMTLGDRASLEARRLAAEAIARTHRIVGEASGHGRGKP